MGHGHTQNCRFAGKTAASTWLRFVLKPLFERFNFKRRPLTGSCKSLITIRWSEYFEGRVRQTTSLAVKSQSHFINTRS
jgi:hypothetical protein